MTTNPAVGRRHITVRVLLAIGVIAASLICVPYILRAWPGLPWEWVRALFVVVVIALIVVVDRAYVRSKASP